MYNAQHISQADLMLKNVSNPTLEVCFFVKAQDAFMIIVNILQMSVFSEGFYIPLLRL